MDARALLRPALGTRARKLERLVSPRQSRYKCICGRVLQNQDHERVTRVQSALKTNSSVLTSGENSRLSPRQSTRKASPFSPTLHPITTWTPPAELHRSRFRTPPKLSRPRKSPL